MKQQKPNPEKEKTDDITAELLAELAVKDEEIAKLKEELKAKSKKANKADKTVDSRAQALDPDFKKFLEDTLAYIKIAQGESGNLPQALIRIVTQVKTRINTELLKEKEDKPPKPEEEVISEAAKTNREKVVLLQIRF